MKTFRMIVFAGFMALFMAAPAGATLLNIYPTVDTYVDAAFGSMSFGNSYYLFAGYKGTNLYRTYLKFDLSGIPDGSTINSATLYLFEPPDNSTSWDPSNGNTPNYFIVSRVENDSSVTNTMTWGTKPDYDSISLGRLTPLWSLTSGTYSVSLSLTDWTTALQTTDLNDNALSLVINSVETFVWGRNFASVETDGTSYDPYLRIDYTAPVPIPAAIWLLGSGLIGLVGLRRKFKK